MSYHYYQESGGNEDWKPIPAAMLRDVAHAMFVTILSVDTPVSEDYTKEQYAGIKYRGNLYFDLDDAKSPASTAAHALTLIDKLVDLGVPEDQVQVYASGGKGFHLLVPETCYMTKPPARGMALLPQIYKEMAFTLAVPSLDLRVYTARKGRMFRQVNVKRENGRYKVWITLQELQRIAKLAVERPADAEAFYADLCSSPRPVEKAPDISATLSTGLLALFDQCKAKVQKSVAKTKKTKPTKLPEKLPSFEALLRGEGLAPDAGFHQIALQAAITAHARGMSCEALLEAAQGLCDNHESDGWRYNSPAKRRAELARMWDYTDDNPCYTFSSGAIASLLSHSAPDLKGLEVSEEEVMAGIADPETGVVVDDDYGHAGVTLTSRGAFTMTEAGPKRLLALGFDNVTELCSVESNAVSVIEADMMLGGKSVGRKVMGLDQFNSVSNFNKVTMPYGQAFVGNDTQARGMFMRLVEKARRSKNRMYSVGREGLDIVSLPFHENEDLRKDFLIWSDIKNVTAQPNVQEQGVKFKFVGFPVESGHFQTDLSQAPSLPTWLADPQNKELLRKTLGHLFHAQKPEYWGKLIGWMVACHYRMLFHKVYTKFPLLHINGAAGAGKTEGSRLLANFHYYNQEPKMLTPTSTLFAVGYAASGSASIPLMLDEFKPSEMAPATYDRFKLMLRDAYNCRNMERGGGTRDNSDYRALQTTALSAPVCFIAEAAESESALMERVVLLTLVKPPAVQAQQYLFNFMEANKHKEVLGIIGSYMAAQIVQRYSLEKLEEEFAPIYTQARKSLMLQAGEEETLDEEALRQKSGAKERTVFNYSVVKFGLVKLRNLITHIFPGEFDKVLNEMIDDVYSNIGELQQQTMPEWLKVMNCFADMAQLDDMAPFYLQQRKDFEIITYNGKDCLEIYARSCYMKYRAYCGQARIKPLFPSESAFVHAINNIPALEAKGLSEGLPAVPGGSHIFSLDELRSAGFITPVTR